ncbi:ribonuclease P protein component [Gammaproteobacteria bacterium]|nr:ribonuclease P protein component [Gammaproteobacteria bacterium]
MAFSRLPRHFYSSKRFRIFFIKDDADNLRVSISKKNFKLAVDRNRIKRQIKETFRKNNLFTSDGCFVVIVYKGYFDTSEATPSFEIVKAVESSNLLLDIKK